MAFDFVVEAEIRKLEKYLIMKACYFDIFWCDFKSKYFPGQLDTILKQLCSNLLFWLATRHKLFDLL